MTEQSIPFRRPRPAPQYPAESEPNPVCTRYVRCEGCVYPSHGFICWHGDGSCMKTDMERVINRRKKDDTT